jgi:NAD(P)-dependent dehydrogenase (short-subunit alcohol dehydrogenase family)
MPCLSIQKFDDSKLEKEQEMAITEKNTTRSRKPVWFITGCSTEFGRQIATHVLQLGYRTDWAGCSANKTKHQIADYANTADKNIRQLRAISSNQDGDPVRAAAAIVQAVESPNPPHRLLLGNDAYDGEIAKLDELREEFKAWEEVSRSADFPKATSAAMA